MELRINSNSSIKLDKFTGIKKINTRVTEFVCKNDTLEGKILIYGSYYQNDLDKKIDFKEVIPFTVVFKDNNYTVKDITCENFAYGEVVGRGLDCNFDVVVIYDPKIEEVVPEVVEVENELEEERPETPEEFEADIETLPVEPLMVETEPVIVSRPTVVKKSVTRPDVDSSVGEENDATFDEPVKEDDFFVQNELLKEDITKHVDKILQTKMEVKTDNDPSLKFKFGGRGDVKKAIKVIYYQHSNDLEAICHQKNLSIDQVFKDNKETDFDLCRRIIVK